MVDRLRICFTFLVVGILVLFALGCGQAVQSARAKIPVILDTDIGDDIDDTWALTMLLKSPELDLKLVVGDNYKSIYRAKLLAKLLTVAGRTDVAVGIGMGNRNGDGRQSDWVKDYDLKSYRGKVHEDGVAAMIEEIEKSPQKVTLIAIGPVQNLAEMLKRKPAIVEKVHFVGMHGSVRRGYGGKAQIDAEYNVREDAKACQAVFKAGWDMIITPLDTCGLIQLKGDKYKTIVESADPLTRALIDNYRIWRREKPADPLRQDETESSTLFDTVAVYLAFSDALTKIEELPIIVDDHGFTRIDPAGKKMEVATEWKDLAAYEDLLVKRVTAPTVKR
ncbi:MAG: nucleoside hydrolase [Phycisphaerae bacterium]|nr:nucleoside hydrolase [Phycisphaerae bacterium]